MLGRHTNIIKFVDALKFFLCKLRLWSKKIVDENYSMFECILMLLEMRNKQKPILRQEHAILHLRVLEEEFKHDFAK